jgi:uncharacterized protein YdeI (BOF family)
MKEKLRRIWQDIKENAREQVDDELKKHFNAKNLLLLIVSFIAVVYVFISNLFGADEEPAPPPTQQKEETTDANSDNQFTFEDKTKAMKSAEIFIRFYMTYDTTQMNRANTQLEKVTKPSLFAQIKEEDQTLRPSAELKTSQWIKTENSYIQEIDQTGYLWTGTVTTEITDMNGNKQQIKNNVSIVVERSLDNPEDWLVSEVHIYDPNDE